jgi:tetratricopeptide (TPR) repeat protein
LAKDTGQWDEAKRAYQFLQENPPNEIDWQAIVEQCYAETLLYRGLDAITALDKAERLAVKSSDALSYRQIKGLCGEVVLRAGKYDEAIRLFEESIQLERKAGSDDVSIPFGALARAYAYKGDHDCAREIVEATEFDDVEIINIAEVYHLISEHNNACEHAVKPYKVDWADGPPYIFWWYLERAKAVLDALSEPYPDMPPYDPSKIGKYPYQDEIEAYIERKRREHEAAG